ncbi:3615_t:CDS:2, partial [Gigaspora margarita]
NKLTSIYKSYKRCYQSRQAAQKSLEKRRNTSHSKAIEQITRLTDQKLSLSNNMTKELMDQELSSSNNALSNNVVTKEEHRKNHLIALIQNFPNEEVLVANHLLTTMCYSKGPDKGKLLSPYLQKKAHKYINDNLYKTQSTNESLQDTNSKLSRENKRLHRQTDKLIKKTQSLDTAFKNKIKSLFKINKKEYSSKSVWLASSIAQVGKMSMYLRLNVQNVSELYVTMQISQIAQASAFGIMVDESTHGEIKNLCNSETISNSVIGSIQKEGLDVTKCILWTTDNTAYMSSNKNGAIALFNRKTASDKIEHEDLKSGLKKMRTQRKKQSSTPLQEKKSRQTS